MWPFSIHLSWLPDWLASSQTPYFLLQVITPSSFLKSLSQNSLSLVDMHKWGKLVTIFFCPRETRLHNSSALAAGRASEKDPHPINLGCVFLDHMLWSDLLFEVMKNSVQRLGRISVCGGCPRSQKTISEPFGARKCGVILVAVSRNWLQSVC